MVNRDGQLLLFADQRERENRPELRLAPGEAALQGLYSQFVFNPKGLTISVYGSLALSESYGKCVATSDDVAVG